MSFCFSRNQNLNLYMRSSQYILLVFAVLTIGCSRKPGLTLSEQTPYILEIKDFQWSYGLTEINKFTGDFEGLDQKVFDVLQGKKGNCEVKLEQKQTDKYGTSTSVYIVIGTINLDELNKYQDWHYWHKDGGIMKLFSAHFVEDKSNTVNIDSIVKVQSTIANQTTPVTTPAKTIASTPPSNPTYDFTIEDLYPLEEDRQRVNPTRTTVNGIIGDVNFLGGVMQVASDEGETFTVQFYPMNGSSYTFNQLHLALKAGNRIKSVCAIAGANNLDLVSATIASN